MLSVIVPPLAGSLLLGIFVERSGKTKSFPIEGKSGGVEISLTTSFLYAPALNRRHEAHQQWSDGAAPVKLKEQKKLTRQLIHK